MDLMVHKISTTTARDILNQLMSRDLRFQRRPTRQDAVLMAGDLQAEGKGYINPDYLLEVWTESIDRHDTLNHERG